MPASADPSSTSAVRLTTGLPETVLPAEPEAVRSALADALAQPGERRRHAVSDVVRAHPTPSQIVEDIWWDADEPENAVRQVRVIMERTRRKLRPFGIEIRNVVRQGYYLPEETRLALRERIGLGRIG